MCVRVHGVAVDIRMILIDAQYFAVVRLAMITDTHVSSVYNALLHNSRSQNFTVFLLEIYNNMHGLGQSVPDTRLWVLLWDLVFAILGSACSYYTPCPEKKSLEYFRRNCIKSWPIFEILLQSQSAENLQ